MRSCTVFETFKGGGTKRLRRLLESGKAVYVLEPFVAYHKIQGKIAGFPDDLPEFVKKAVQKGHLPMITAKDLNARDIYQISIDRAVDFIEQVWPAYLREHKRIVRFTCDVLDSGKVVNAFKRTLGERLAEYFSAHEVYRRLCQHLSPAMVRLHADTNLHSYISMQRLLRESGCEIRNISTLTFPAGDLWLGRFDSVTKALKFTTRVIAQAMVSLWNSTKDTSNAGLRKFTYGTTVISPRQFEDNQRGPDFFVDGNDIKREEVLYFPLYPLSPEKQRLLESRCENVLVPPAMGRFFSDPTAWFGLLFRALMDIRRYNGEEIRTASVLMFHYFIWKHLLQTNRIRHFITHCDFNLSHMGRNIALHQAGVSTWYFSDSMNFGNNLKGYIPGCRMRHPYWTYLDYEHFVTWHQALADYFQDHAAAFRQIHIVGCLWAEHSSAGNGGRKRVSLQLHEKMAERFLIAVFDTTYSRNITINYTEGIAFAEHIMHIAASIPEVHIVFKEKKGREIHDVFDRDNGSRLVALYDRMAGRDNISFLGNTTDASDLIKAADMVVSFPFTSTTFEALSINKAAIWHDPLGFYRKNLYAGENGVVTHGIDELEERIHLELQRVKNNSAVPSISAGSPLMDPFRDGKGVNRFRRLLLNADG